VVDIGSLNHFILDSISAGAYGKNNPLNGSQLLSKRILVSAVAERIPLV
jgi:hypothetical protein